MQDQADVAIPEKPAMPSRAGFEYLGVPVVIFYNWTGEEGDDDEVEIKSVSLPGNPLDVYDWMPFAVINQMAAWVTKLDEEEFNESVADQQVAAMLSDAGAL